MFLKVESIKLNILCLKKKSYFILYLVHVLIRDAVRSLYTMYSVMLGGIARLIFVTELAVLLSHHGHHRPHPGEHLLHHLAAVASHHCSSRILFMAQTNSKAAFRNC